MTCRLSNAKVHTHLGQDDDCSLVNSRKALARWLTVGNIKSEATMSMSCEIENA